MANPLFGAGPSAPAARAPRETQGVRIGIHVSAAGGAAEAVRRARALGCDTFQIFTSSPRQWRAAALAPAAAQEAIGVRAECGLAPMVVHANYLINLAGAKADFRDLSRLAFRGEIDRARALGAEYLVLHPGSAAGGSGPAAALSRLETGIRDAADGFDWGGLRLLIENTAGGGGRLGGSFEEVAEILDRLRGLPVGACIDTCHCWVAGYDLASPEGFETTLAELDRTLGFERVPVFHVNDAKAERGSRLDRHQHIGEGRLGEEAFARLLRHPQLRGKAFIAETPVDEPGDQERDLATLRRLAAAAGPAAGRKRR